MPALDFPPSPVVGDKYPVTPAPGVPQYTWDGEKWTTTGAQVTSASPSNNLPLMDATPAVPGVGTQYSREDHVHPTDTSRAADTVVLKKSPQSLTVTEQTDVRKNVYAAPLDALAYSGMQINGSMDVSQELGTIGRTTGGYICDGWTLAKAGAAAVTATQATTVGLFAGLPYYLSINVSTASGSLAAGDLVVPIAPIEGYRIARLAWGSASAQPITIGFWACHNRTGIYSVTILNAAGTRSYAATYTQNVSNTAEYKTVTIPGCTDGAWNTTNGIGIQIAFAMAAGSTYIAPSNNSWLTATYFAGTGQINGVAATSDAFRITGVVVLPGSEAPAAARSPLIMRPFDQELLTCKRYYQKTFNGSGSAYATFAVQMIFSYDEMRATPTLSIPAAFTINEPTGGVKTQSSPSVTAVENYPSFAFANFVNFTGLTVTRSYWTYSSTPLILDARL